VTWLQWDALLAPMGANHITPEEAPRRLACAYWMATGTKTNGCLAEIDSTWGDDLKQVVIVWGIDGF
jgi:hypothetical protein